MALTPNEIAVFISAFLLGFVRYALYHYFDKLAAKVLSVGFNMVKRSITKEDYEKELYNTHYRAARYRNKNKHHKRNR